MSGQTNNGQQAIPLSMPLWLKIAPLTFIIFWAGGFTFGKMGLTSAGPFTLLSMRYFFTGIAFAVMFLVLRPAMPTARSDWQQIIISGFILQVVYFSCVYQAMDYGLTAGAVAVIACLQPILIAILSPKITGETIRPRQWFGFVLGLGGSMLVIGTQADINFKSGLGLCLAIGALLTMSTLTLYEKRRGTSQHPVTVNLIQNAVGFGVTVLLALIIENYQFEATRELYVSLFYLVICNSIIAVTLLLGMIRYGEASKVSALFFLIPPAAVIIAWVFLGETIAPLAWFGVLATAIGVSFARSNTEQQAEPAEKP